MKNHPNIAVITTVINFDLYRKTNNLFPEGIQYYAIDGRNGMHGIHSIFYAFKKLKNKGIEWLIMADEDVIFLDSQLVFSVIKYMNEKKYSFCGVRDGGVISHRNYNPFAMNTFFSILRFEKISSFFNKKEIMRHQYISLNEFSDDFQAPFPYDKESLYEPYYCFYFWLRRKGENFLFLDSEMFGKDGISNFVKNHKGENMLIHTWYARSYGINKKHTERIDGILKTINIIDAKRDIIIFKSYSFYWIRLIKKFKKRIEHYININSIFI